MADRELDVTRLMESGSDTYTENDLRNAIDAASDQGTTTWLTVNGKRVAKIAPADEIPEDVVEAVASFLRMSRDERREAIRARWAQPPPEPVPVREMTTVQHGAKMIAHDGFAAHCHAVRPDHLGVPRQEA